MTTNKFTDIEKLIKSVLSYPRRVVYKDIDGALAFESDDGVMFVISLEDLKKSVSENHICRTIAFSKAFNTQSGKEQYIQSINYGKPDWNEK